MLFHHVQEGVHQLVVLDGEDLVHILLDVGEHLLPRRLHRHTVGDGLHPGQGDHMARLQAGLHGGRPRRLHPDHLHMGVEQLGQGGHPGGQPAPANGHQNHVHIGQILEDLVGDGALARGHGEVVKGVNVGQPLLLTQLGGQGRRVVKGLPLKDDPGPVVLGVIHLHQGGGGGHDHRGGDARSLGGIGHPLGMVAGGGGDQPPLLFLPGEGGALEVGPPDLIGPGDLHIFRFDVHVIPCGLGERGAVHQVGGVQHPFQHPTGRFEIFQCHHGNQASSPTGGPVP